MSANGEKRTIVHETEIEEINGAKIEKSGRTGETKKVTFKNAIEKLREQMDGKKSGQLTPEQLAAMQQSQGRA